MDKYGVTPGEDQVPAQKQAQAQGQAKEAAADPKKCGDDAISKMAEAAARPPYQPPAEKK